MGKSCWYKTKCECGNEAMAYVYGTRDKFTCVHCNSSNITVIPESQFTAEDIENAMGMDLEDVNRHSMSDFPNKILTILKDHLGESPKMREVTRDIMYDIWKKGDLI